MRSFERTTANKWTRASTLLLLTACAGCTSISVAGNNSDACSDYVPPAMWAPTLHAPAPGTSQASHGSFEIAEAGQLEKANADKDGTHYIITVCETKKAAALATAKKRNAPWYKRIF